MTSPATRLKQPSITFSELETILTGCTDCRLCMKECVFLQKYGSPVHIAESYKSGENVDQGISFECSLCGLCGAVCPVGIDPTRMFLEMRRNSMREGAGEWPEHKGLIRYEQTGTSKRYSWYGLPEHCDTVFFPGCALPGTRPDATYKLYEHMKKSIPALGIVLDCCTKPSHDLGREEVFDAMFSEMRDYLTENGIKTVLVGCPNCFNVFKQYGGSLHVKTIYEVMADIGIPESGNLSEFSVTIHDPCVLRHEPPAHNAVRELISNRGIQIREMDHSRDKALCCGEGGAVACISPELSDAWTGLRQNEAGDQRVITYCAGCANFLSKTMSADHIADLVFEPENTLAGKAKVSSAPFTYLNRLRLKRQFKKNVPAATFRERPFVPGGTSKKSRLTGKIVLIALIAAAFFLVRQANVQTFFEQESLRTWIEGFGILAPVVFMLIYTIAPVLFIPALPLTVAGGILFGPFWGVVYCITGATSGACLSFLISRYFLRNWVESKLTNPRWKKLDAEVEQNGWKVVAFTRLIPLFPFNLLNYAFGLTNIRFFHYAVTTFLCMLPACIAFIVFSSSLTDLIMGRVSVEFFAGILLIVLVSMIPLIWRKISPKK